MSRLSLKFATFLFACVFACSAFALDGGPQAVPPLTSHVTDLTATLDADQQQSLDAQLAALEQRKGAQLAVLIVPTTQPEDITEYAIRVFDAWKLGRKNIDDGALLIIAKDDRSMRIEVARGLEGTIPDAAAARIIREYLTPKFRDGDFYGGIKDALDAMTQLVDGEPLPEPRKDPEGGAPFDAIMFGLFAGFWARSMFGRLSSVPRAGLVGAVSGGVGWLVSSLLPVGIGLAAFGVVLGFFGGGGGGFANRGGYGNWGGGGFGGGGFGGGGGGGGSSGGGFSGGGGISAGGGASGRW